MSKNPLPFEPKQLPTGKEIGNGVKAIVYAVLGLFVFVLILCTAVLGLFVFALIKTLIS